MRRWVIAWIVVALTTVALPWRPGAALTVIFDNRADWTIRPNGTAIILGDSVGYGLVKALEGWGGPNMTARLATDGWGPLRSYTLAGLHAAPEGAGDPHNVTTWINTFRGEGFLPRVAVIVSGANDVGWLNGDSVARNEQRIDTAMSSLGTTEVVWTTITHGTAAKELAWNTALRNVATRRPNLHVCEWAPIARSNPGAYLSSDSTHPTPTGYRLMRDTVAGCVAQYGAQARALGTPPAGPIAAAGAAGKLQAQVPGRVLDTRATSPLPGGWALRVHVAAPGSTAAALNLTAVGAAGPGYLVAYPCDRPVPGSSSLNYLNATPVAGGVTVGVDSAGDACILTSATTHLLVDVQGTYKAGGSLGFTPLAPARVADTRWSGVRLAPGGVLEVPVGAPAGWLNLTAVGATGGGFLTAYPCGGTIPYVSNLNYAAGPQAIANAASVTADANGKVCVVASAPVHVAVDLGGRFGPGGSAFVPAVPQRVLDTRGGTGGWQGSVRGGQVVTVDLATGGALPPAATGVVATLTAIPDRTVFAVAYPAGQAMPDSSNLNPPGWIPTANAVTVAGRQVALQMPPGHGYLLLDVTGWWQ